MKGLFVTGTDTGVGKTFVACALVRAARATGRRVFAFKPIETGCVPGSYGEDQQALAEAAGDVVRGTYRLFRPVAPWMAARAEGVEIDLGRVQNELEVGASSAEYVVVEGAGGWRVPITRTTGISDLARCIGLPILVVARAGLGTINHSLLTIDAIRHDALPVAGLVLSPRPGESSELTADNASAIHERAGVRVWIWPDFEGLLPSC